MIELHRLPGNLVRRLHQISVGIFLQETEAYGITPVQFAALQSIQSTPGMDQRTLASVVGQDASTTTGVLDRLENRGLIRREPSPTDRRARSLYISDAGVQLLNQVRPAVLRAQELLLEPLSEKQKDDFLRLAKTLVEGNNKLSRAPRMPPSV